MTAQPVDELRPGVFSSVQVGRPGTRRIAVGGAGIVPEVLDPTSYSADFTLRWPPDVFEQELTALRAAAVSASAADDRIEFLLWEAFTSDTAASQYRALLTEQKRADDPWGVQTEPGSDEHRPYEFLVGLLQAAPHLPVQREPRPYWPDRHGHDRGRVDHPGLRRRFAQLVAELRRAGRFGNALPEDCVDAEPPEGDALLTERLGIPGLWPLQPDQWDTDTFYGLIEVFHDLSVRPRQRTYHSHDGCGWHFSSFSITTGQALYRWRVNRLLETADIGLRLADDGEDAGRLVRTVDDARAELFDRALATPNQDIRARVEHAISQFRARTATEHDTRSAVLTLAGLLEERRQLIRTGIGRTDEGALFRIANDFAIRHQRRGQYGDYDPAFLDWMFWWYLATVELTERILTRQADPDPDAAPNATTPP